MKSEVTTPPSFQLHPIFCCSLLSVIQGGSWGEGHKVAQPAGAKCDTKCSFLPIYELGCPACPGFVQQVLVPSPCECSSKLNVALPSRSSVQTWRETGNKEITMQCVNARTGGSAECGPGTRLKLWDDGSGRDSQKTSRRQDLGNLGG